MKLFFIRHGQTNWNQSQLIQGRIDNQINDTAIEQIKDKANYFNNINPTHLYHTSLIRTKQTLDIIKEKQKWQLEPMISDLLIERDFGALEGQSTDTYYNTKNFETIVDYESDSSLLARVESAITYFNINHSEDDTIIFITHAHILKTLLIFFKYTDNYNIKLNNCAILEVTLNFGSLSELKIIN